MKSNSRSLTNSAKSSKSEWYFFSNHFDKEQDATVEFHHFGNNKSAGSDNNDEIAGPRNLADNGGVQQFDCLDGNQINQADIQLGRQNSNHTDVDI